MRKKKRKKRRRRKKKRRRRKKKKKRRSKRKRRKKKNSTQIFHLSSYDLHLLRHNIQIAIFYVLPIIITNDLCNVWKEA